MATDVKVPALGESITEGTLAQWLKKSGDAVAADEPIASLENDKVTVEVPSPAAGVLSETLVDEGESVEVGAIIARIDEESKGGAAAEESTESTQTNPAGAGENPAPREAETDEAPEAEPAKDGVETSDSDQIMTLSPAVRRAVLEHHVDPSRIKGTGKDGRLTKDYVIAAAEAQKAGVQPVAQAKAEASGQVTAGATSPRDPGLRRDDASGRKEERVPMSRLRRTIAKRLKEAQNSAALLTTFNDVDMSAVIEARARYKDLFEKKHGIRLGFMGFFVKAVA
ncbi:MAG: biotin/lipoyl-containing protein, partial [Sphingomicrobium sp.]